MNDLEKLKKLEGKEFRIDAYYKHDNLLFLNASGSRIKIKSNQRLSIALDENMALGAIYQCLKVKEYWFNHPLPLTGSRGFKIETDKGTMRVLTSLNAQLEVEEIG